jgi:Fe-S cluster biogenesis protein NfuA/nitrite reductase/ring-hydroxylating ferredoxin subunit
MAIEAQRDQPTGGQELLERIEQLTAAIDAAADPFLRGTVDELVSAIIELYGEGLTRIVRELAEQGEEGLLLRLAGDGVIGSLLLIHDLYPIPLEDRVEEALASVRPYMESHGGDVQLLRLEDGVAHLKLVGHCHGCPASAATLELAIKEALEEAAPDLLGLEVEGVAEPKPIRKPLAMAAQPIAAPAGAPGWLPFEEAGEIEPGTFRALALEGVDLVVANVDGTVLAYRDRCAACEATLREASLAGPLLMCSDCGCAFDLTRAGRAAAGEEHLDPVPLLRRGGRAYEVALA